MEQPVQLEQMLKIKASQKRFTLGLPSPQNDRRPLVLITPEGVSMLAAHGIDVRIEKGLGDSIHYDDMRYSRAGATVVNRSEAFRCDVVVYAGRMTPDEASCMQPQSILLTMIHNRPPLADTVRTFVQRRITVVALDRVRDFRGKYPLADIMGEVSGRAAVIVAASIMADPSFGKGILPGGVAGVNPCEVVILGTGMAALAAARSSIGLGGMVRLFDSDPYCLRTAMAELGPAVIGSALHPVVLGHALAAADVIIATRLQRGFAVDESVLDSMKAGVIIIDVDDHDGISKSFPSLRCVDVTDFRNRGLEPGRNLCLTNPVGAVPRTTSMALTNDVLPIIERLFTAGRGLTNVLKTDAGLRNAVLVYQGRVVNREMAENVSVKYIDISLLLSFS